MGAVDFTGQCVIVTGAGNGMGRAYALSLGRLGALVVVNDIGGSTDGVGASRRAADFVVAEIVAAGGRAVASYDSVANDPGCRSIAEAALDSFGRIDAVVHNAGILRNAPFGEMADERFFPVLETHLLGAFYLSRAVWPTMVAQEYGRLVFTSSASGLWGRIDGSNYGAAKAGIIGLCNVLALEGKAHGILSNAILPMGATRLAGLPDAADLSPDAARRRAEVEATRMSASWVSPLAVYLASSACDRTHRYYSAIRGRYAEAFVGVTGGWVAPDGDPPTPDDLAAHLDLIEDRASSAVPTDTFDEARLASGRVDAVINPS